MHSPKRPSRRWPTGSPGRRGSGDGPSATVIANRGDVYDMAFPSSVGRRPAVVVTREVAIPVLTNLAVVPITRTTRSHLTEVALGRECGLDHDSVASCDNIATVPAELFGRRRGQLGPVELRALATALRIALELD